MDGQKCPPHPPPRTRPTRTGYRHRLRWNLSLLAQKKTPILERMAREKMKAVLDAEVRIGELMAKVPKASGGQPFHVHEKPTTDTAVQSRAQTKAEVIAQAGFTPKQVQRFETLAAHPDLVAQAKAEAHQSSCIRWRNRH